MGGEQEGGGGGGHKKSQHLYFGPSSSSSLTSSCFGLKGFRFFLSLLAAAEEGFLSSSPRGGRGVSSRALKSAFDFGPGRAAGGGRKPASI